jgi:hypothetical protein
MNLNVLADSRVIPDAWVLVEYFCANLGELLGKAAASKS